MGKFVDFFDNLLNYKFLLTCLGDSREEVFVDRTPGLNCCCYYC